MGGAKSQRRRAKLALEAQYGNLYKAQFGKASRHDRLPEPPTAKQLQPVLPRKFKKMQALMELAQHGQVGAKRSSDDGQSNRGNKRQKREEGQEPERAASDVGKASTRKEAPNNGTAETTSDAGRSSEVPTPAAAAIQSAPASKTKLKRKEVLKQKKQLKKLKRQVARMGGGSETDDADERDLKRDHVEFGEVSAAPPKVNLKRRHWDAEQTEASHRSRNKEMMLKYMKAADARLAKGSTTPVSLHLRRKAQEQERMRHKLVEAYRDHKRQQSGETHASKAAKPGGTATLQTLKRLVQSQADV